MFFATRGQQQSGSVFLAGDVGVTVLTHARCVHCLLIFICLHIIHILRASYSVLAFTEGTSCSNPVEGQGDDGEEATPCAEGEGEGDGAPPQRKRQRVSRAKGRSSESESALRHDKENGSDAECPVVDGIPDRVEPSNGCGTVPLMCCEPVSSSQGDTAMDFSEPSEAVSLNNVSPIKSEPRVQSNLSSPRYDSDSDDDDDLPSVSVSFGTPTHEGLTCKSIHTYLSQFHITTHPVPSSLPTSETLSPPSHQLTVSWRVQCTGWCTHTIHPGLPW